MSDAFETMVARVPGALQDRRRCVRLVVDGAVASFALPEDAQRVLGRGQDAQIHVNHATVSRRHAELSVVKGEIKLTDLGSVNGTRIGSRELTPNEPNEIQVGEVFGLGDVVAVVLDGLAEARPSRSVGRDDLVHALERAIAFASEEGPFSVVALACSEIAAYLDTIAALTPARGHVAALGQGVVVVLLPGMDRTAGAAWLDGVSAFFMRRGVDLVTRLTACPDDGATVTELCPQAVSGGATALTPQKVSAAPAPAPSAASPAMRKLHELIEQVAATPASILILGETGVGKEVTARLVHTRSNREAGPFVALNCAALPESLLESELFGYEKGAFTGAQNAKPGLIEAASGGTLFLDELGEMPLSTQAKLLRVLEERTVLRVGSVKPKPVDIRLVAATNRDLQEEIQSKRFRPDLYYRLNGIVLRIPPLRERKAEIRSLATMFAQKAADALGRPTPSIPPDVHQALESYAWPGNVRELRNTIERLVLLAQGGIVTKDHLPDEMRSALGMGSMPPPAMPPPRAATPSFLAEIEVTTVNATIPPSVGPISGHPPSSGMPASGSLEDEIARIERTKIMDALDKCAGNQTRAAEMLGITRRVLIRKLEKYNLPRPRK